MVTAWLVTTVGWSTSSSPGSGRWRSARVDPAVRPSHCPTAVAPTTAATIASPARRVDPLSIVTTPAK
jgi:hypothetical protein